MKNLVEISDYQVKYFTNMQSLAFAGFMLGGDNYGEIVTGVSTDVGFHDFGGKEYYTVTVFLRESDTHTSTSGIGFYITHEEELMVYSSRKVLKVGLTRELRETLAKAKESELNRRKKYEEDEKK